MTNVEDQLVKVQMDAPMLLQISGINPNPTYEKFILGDQPVSALRDRCLCKYPFAKKVEIYQGNDPLWGDAGRPEVWKTLWPSDAKTRFFYSDYQTTRSTIWAAADLHRQKNMFLAGPTPRSPEVPSWRVPDAVDILIGDGSEEQVDCNVWIPEWSDMGRATDYMTQVEWEKTGLVASERSGVIVFWVPREMETMPAFTTNVEFGHYVGPRALYGRPDGAPKTQYLDWLYYDVTGRRPATSLQELLKQAVQFLRSGRLD